MTNERLLEVARNALGAYEALKLVGADRHLPGYELCLRELNAAINEAEAAVQPEPVALRNALGQLTEHVMKWKRAGTDDAALAKAKAALAAQPLTPPAGLTDALPLKDQRAIEDMRQFLQMPSDEKKAAVRYLWLRDANNWTEDGLVVCSGNGEDTCYGEALDHAIDRAMLSALPKSQE